MKEFKDVFAWTYKDLKGILLKLAQHKLKLDIIIPSELAQHKLKLDIIIPSELAQHIIELDTTIPLAHHAMYKFNPNYVKVIKQAIDKLLAFGFIQFVEEATWLSPIVVVPKKNGKLKKYINFEKLNATTKKDPYQYGK